MFGLVAALAAVTYTNPLIENCADPSSIRGDNSWFVYCTSDPLTDGDPKLHLISIHRSDDLAHWNYVGDVFAQRPSWIAADSGLWAPAIKYIGGRYILYYTAQKTAVAPNGSAIGAAVSDSPAGPWTDSGGPVVEPRDNACCQGSPRWTFDPEVIEWNGTKYIYFGSYYGGIFVRTLSDDGLKSDPASEVMIGSANRYEGVNIVRHGDWLYLLASSSDCCRGPLTGYSVYALRADNPMGPFVDRDGASMLDGRTGGTVVISMNGNRWVGPGHNAVFTDFAGQDWFLYHAVDVNHPYFEGATGLTKRPLLVDPLDWIGDWPTVRGGRWASDSPEPAPAAQPGSKTDYRMLPPPWTFTQVLPEYSDDFGGTLGRQWSWIRQPSSGTGLDENGFRFDTQNAELFEDSNNASILTEAAPAGDFIVETELRFNVPPSGACCNYAQAGLVIYRDDDDYVKLVHSAIWETRETEFGKEVSKNDGFPRYGSTFAGPPGEVTWLRISRTTAPEGTEQYTAYTSRDGQWWQRGGTWTHSLGTNARIGLVSMSRAGFTAEFRYVHVYAASAPTQPLSR